MKYRNRNGGLRPAVLALATAAALALSACGGGSDQAQKLLRETFTGTHRVSSGVLAMVLSITPSGASALKGPAMLSLAGPFQTLSGGRLPASQFNLSLTATGTTAAATITSTGSVGYVTYQGQSYRLPPATYQRLEGSFTRLGSLPGAGGGAGALGRLGIHPQRWLTNPQIIGDEAIQGTNTTRIKAGINMTALLDDLGTFLKRAAAAGVTAARSLLPPAERRRIAEEVRNARVNVWTGVADTTLRRLAVELTVPVSGQLSALLGRSAAIGLTLEYAQLNQPQTVSAPTKLLPYSQFQDKLRALVQDLRGNLLNG